MKVATDGGIVCLTGVDSLDRVAGVVTDAAATVVLRSDIIVGSVNANKRHWSLANSSRARELIAAS